MNFFQLYKGDTMYYDKMITYFSEHVMLNSFAHTAGGFGLALLLQHYIKGDAFLPPLVGWVLVAISVVIHIISMM